MAGLTRGALCGLLLCILLVAPQASCSMHRLRRDLAKDEVALPEEVGSMRQLANLDVGLDSKFQLGGMGVSALSYLFGFTGFLFPNVGWLFTEHLQFLAGTAHYGITLPQNLFDVNYPLQWLNFQVPYPWDASPDVEYNFETFGSGRDLHMTLQPTASFPNQHRNMLPHVLFWAGALMIVAFLVGLPFGLSWALRGLLQVVLLSLFPLCLHAAFILQPCLSESKASLYGSSFSRANLEQNPWYESTGILEVDSLSASDCWDTNETFWFQRVLFALGTAVFVFAVLLCSFCGLLSCHRRGVLKAQAYILPSSAVVTAPLHMHVRPSQWYHVPFSMLVRIVTAGALGGLQHWPLLQGFIVTGSSLLYLIYLVWKQPYARSFHMLTDTVYSLLRLAVAAMWLLVVCSLRWSATDDADFSVEFEALRILHYVTLYFFSLVGIIRFALLLRTCCRIPRARSHVFRGPVGLAWWQLQAPAGARFHDSVSLGLVRSSALVGKFARTMAHHINSRDYGKPMEFEVHLAGRGIIPGKKGSDDMDMNEIRTSDMNGRLSAMYRGLPALQYYHGALLRVGTLPTPPAARKPLRVVRDSGGDHTTAVTTGANHGKMALQQQQNADAPPAYDELVHVPAAPPAFHNEVSPMPGPTMALEVDIPGTPLPSVSSVSAAVPATPLGLKTDLSRCPQCQQLAEPATVPLRQFRNVPYAIGCRRQRTGPLRAFEGSTPCCRKCMCLWRCGPCCCAGQRAEDQHGDVPCESHPHLQPDIFQETTLSPLWYFLWLGTAFPDYDLVRPELSEDAANLPSTELQRTVLVTDDNNCEIPSCDCASTKDADAKVHVDQAMSHVEVSTGGGASDPFAAEKPVVRTDTAVVRPKRIDTSSLNKSSDTVTSSQQTSSSVTTTTTATTTTSDASNSVTTASATTAAAAESTGGGEPVTFEQKKSPEGDAGAAQDEEPGQSVAETPADTPQDQDSEQPSDGRTYSPQPRQFSPRAERMRARRMSEVRKQQQRGSENAPAAVEMAEMTSTTTTTTTTTTSASTAGAALVGAAAVTGAVSQATASEQATPTATAAEAGPATVVDAESEPQSPQVQDQSPEPELPTAAETAGTPAFGQTASRTPTPVESPLAGGEVGLSVQGESAPSEAGLAYPHTPKSSTTHEDEMARKARLSVAGLPDAGRIASPVRHVPAGNSQVEECLEGGVLSLGPRDPGVNNESPFAERAIRPASVATATSQTSAAAGPVAPSPRSSLYELEEPWTGLQRDEREDSVHRDTLPSAVDTHFSQTSGGSAQQTTEQEVAAATSQQAAPPRSSRYAVNLQPPPGDGTETSVSSRSRRSSGSLVEISAAESYADFDLNPLQPQSSAPPLHIFKYQGAGSALPATTTTGDEKAPAVYTCALDGVAAEMFDGLSYFDFWPHVTGHTLAQSDEGVDAFRFSYSLPLGQAQGDGEQKEQSGAQFWSTAPESVRVSACKGYISSNTDSFASMHACGWSSKPVGTLRFGGLPCLLAADTLDVPAFVPRKGVDVVWNALPVRILWSVAPPLSAGALLTRRLAYEYSLCWVDFAQVLGAQAHSDGDFLTSANPTEREGAAMLARMLLKQIWNQVMPRARTSAVSQVQRLAGRSGIEGIAPAPMIGGASPDSRPRSVFSMLRDATPTVSQRRLGNAVASPSSPGTGVVSRPAPVHVCVSNFPLTPATWAALVALCPDFGQQPRHMAWLDFPAHADHRDVEVPVYSTTPQLATSVANDAVPVIQHSHDEVVSFSQMLYSLRHDVEVMVPAREMAVLRAPVSLSGNELFRFLNRHYQQSTRSFMLSLPQRTPLSLSPRVPTSSPARMATVSYRPDMNQDQHYQYLLSVLGKVIPVKVLGVTSPSTLTVPAPVSESKGVSSVADAVFSPRAGVMPAVDAVRLANPHPPTTNIEGGNLEPRAGSALHLAERRPDSPLRPPSTVRPQTFELPPSPALVASPPSPVGASQPKDLPVLLGAGDSSSSTQALEEPPAPPSAFLPPPADEDLPADSSPAGQLADVHVEFAHVETPVLPMQVVASPRRSAQVPTSVRIPAERHDEHTPVLPVQVAPTPKAASAAVPDAPKSFPQVRGPARRPRVARKKNLRRLSFVQQQVEHFEWMQRSVHDGPGDSDDMFGDVIPVNAPPSARKPIMTLESSQQPDEYSDDA